MAASVSRTGESSVASAMFNFLVAAFALPGGIPVVREQPDGGRPCLLSPDALPLRVMRISPRTDSSCGYTEQPGERAVEVGRRPARGGLPEGEVQPAAISVPITGGARAPRRSGARGVARGPSRRDGTSRLTHLVRARAGPVVRIIAHLGGGTTFTVACRGWEHGRALASRSGRRGHGPLPHRLLCSPSGVSSGVPGVHRRPSGSRDAFLTVGGPRHEGRQTVSLQGFRLRARQDSNLRPSVQLELTVGLGSRGHRRSQVLHPEKLDRELTCARRPPRPTASWPGCSSAASLARR